MNNEPMDPTLKQHILFGLENWVCEQWTLSATDEVIDLVVDAHFAMFADQ